MEINKVNLQELRSGCIAILGVPWDENSSFQTGAALAPPAIRQVLLDGASNLGSEVGVDLDQHPQLCDVGDLELGSGSIALHQIEKAVDECLSKKARVISLGGDHAITYPILMAYARHYPKLNLLQIDAHPDLYDIYDGNPLSHACPFARIMENHLASRLVQVGIRSVNQHLHQQAGRFCVEMNTMRDWSPDLHFTFDGPVYISLDLDALDPAYAPGVSHHEPGGLTTRQVLQLIDAVQAPIVGADIVELNPHRDINQMTARVAAKLLKEIAARMLLSPPC